MHTMRVTLMTGLLFLGMCGWVEERCGSENLLTMAQGSKVESFEVRDLSGGVLWHIEAPTPHSVRSLRLGVIPSGFVQTVPEHGSPRDFTPGETLVTYTVAKERTLLHKGQATGPRAFCGGYYRSKERESAQGPTTALSGGDGATKEN